MQKYAELGIKSSSDKSPSWFEGKQETNRNT